jgi:hypothetical protein
MISHLEPLLAKANECVAGTEDIVTGSSTKLKGTCAFTQVATSKSKTNKFRIPQK